MILHFKAITLKQLQLASAQAAVYMHSVEMSWEAVTCLDFEPLFWTRLWSLSNLLSLTCLSLT